MYYVCDSDNSRITRWMPNSIFGVCIAGCTSAFRILLNQLDWDLAFTFDRNGSFYVSDNKKNIEYKNFKFSITLFHTIIPKSIRICHGTNVKFHFPAQPSLVSIHLGIFIDSDDTMYIADYDNHQILIWSINTSQSICIGLLVDVKNNLYCSIRSEHQVVKASFNSHNSTVMTVAGTNRCIATNELNQP
ncbi:unnamed protein product [Adineta ricciae]|uniref:Uncharacterized protein n=1 Tax=Adineta ricciae TaxID=249248 RepID=A0A815JJF2_ADIRI|nr:unnamed protein product [Adineta ricciae]CAF1491572.1 unnamed protein product [Adineta ricciae]